MDQVLHDRSLGCWQYLLRIHWLDGWSRGEKLLEALQAKSGGFPGLIYYRGFPEIRLRLWCSNYYRFQPLSRAHPRYDN